MVGLDEREEAGSRDTEVDGYADDALCVIGIGASAGGFAALQAFFAAMPESPGLAFVVVMHLSPHHDSQLAELLQRYTPMRVRQVRQSVKLAPDTVYVIPPNANLTAVDSHLRISTLERRRRDRAPIDHFLRTLAFAHGSHAVAVILSGSGSDGSLGVRHIKQQSGLTVVQDPREAEFDSMPRSAMASDAVDKVLPAAAMAAQILTFCRVHPRVPLNVTALSQAVRTVLTAVIAHVGQIVGEDISVYRQALVLRQIRRRMRLADLEEPAAYLEKLRGDADETRALYSEIVTNVSEFFSDAGLVAILQERLLPALFQRKVDGDRLRVWSVGCSTGEDAYSIAMLMMEEAARHANSTSLQVFSTDLSPELLRRARLGTYPAEVAACIPEAWLERYFVKEDGQYRVRPELREIVVFCEHNVLLDSPYAHIDLIECRSLLSELEAPVRRAVLELFHFALEPHGFLLVSPLDVVNEPLLFEWEDQRHGVLRRCDAKRTYVGGLVRAGTVERRTSATPASVSDPTRLAALHFHLAGHLVPPSVLLDAEDHIVHYSESAARYLRVAGGEFTQALFKMVPPPLVPALRATLDQVRHTGTAQVSAPLKLELEGGPREIEIEIQPSGPDSAGLVLVVFKELAGLLPQAAAGTDTGVPSIEQLRTELDIARDRVGRLIKSHAADTEALAADNAELVKINHELSLVLDALQSSHEELQAHHQKMIALDGANRRRFRDLAQMSRDLHHLLESTGLATMFLDRDLRLVRFTPQICDLFSVHQSDVGHSIVERDHGLLHESLWDDVHEVLERETIRDCEIQSAAGKWFLCRILPYRNTQDEVEGVALTLVDITERKDIEQRLRDADRRKDEFLAVLAHELRNPLAPIVTGLDVLKAADDNPDMVSRISTAMTRQARQLVRIVDDLLEVSRVTGGRLQVRRAPVALQDVLRDAVESIQPLIDECGHRLSIHMPPERVMLNADGARLTQVFANLLSNAARYTETGGHIELSARVAGANVEVTVRDSGVGLPPESLERIFEMFYKHDEARSPAGVGLGIGLTLARSLVEMHGGAISASSAGPGCGSEFTVTLPVVASDEARATSAPAAASRQCGGHRVLIVDDNTDAAQTLQLLVAMLGDNEVHLAFNGADALRIAAEHKPDIVLLDLKMPNMDGFEVARRLRGKEWGRRVLLVAVSGWAQDEHKSRAQSAGFDRHLSKPVARADLEAVLQRE